MEKQSLLCFTDTSSSSDSPLHTIHSDIDKEMNAIVTLLEEDGDYQNKKQEIKYKLEEYNRSYQSLAEKYDCLKFIFINTLDSASSSEIFRCNLKCNNDMFEKEFLIKLREELVTSKLRWENSNNRRYGRITAHPDINRAEIKINEFELRATMLMEENLQHQEELARRNNQKREAIKELQQQIHCLKSEQRALQSCLRFTKEKFKPHRSPISRLAETISNKLRRRGCS